MTPDEAYWRIKAIDSILLAATGNVGNELMREMLRAIERIVRDPA